MSETIKVGDYVYVGDYPTPYCVKKIMYDVSGMSSYVSNAQLCPPEVQRKLKACDSEKKRKELLKAVHESTQAYQKFVEEEEAAAKQTTK